METVIDKSRADPVPVPDNNGGGISPSKVTFCESVKDEQEEDNKETREEVGNVRVNCDL